MSESSPQEIIEKCPYCPGQIKIIIGPIVESFHYRFNRVIHTSSHPCIFAAGVKLDTLSIKTKKYYPSSSNSNNQNMNKWS
jgi:hypothetical protein